MCTICKVRCVAVGSAIALDARANSIASERVAGIKSAALASREGYQRSFVCASPKLTTNMLRVTVAAEREEVEKATKRTIVIGADERWPNVGIQETRTRVLPNLRPASMSMKARGAASRPSTISSR